MTYLEKLLDGAPVEWRSLGEVCKVIRGERVTKKDLVKDGAYPVVSGGAGYMGFLDRYNREACTITVAQYGTAGVLAWQSQRFWANDVCYSILPDNSQLNNKFLYYFLATKQAYIYSRVNREAYPPSLARKVLLEIEIPLPPLAVQQQIVEILDKFTALEAELEARGRQFRYYRNKLLQFGEEVEWKPLGEVCRYEQPAKYIVESTDYKDSFPIPVLTAGKTFVLGYTDEVDGIYPASKHPVIIFDDFTGALRWIDFDFKVKSSAMKLITSKDESLVLLRFVFYWLSHLPSLFIAHDHQRLWLRKYAPLLIPLPPLAVQEQIVAVLDKFYTLVHSLSEGLPAEIALRQQQYKYYRRRLLDFPKP